MEYLTYGVSPISDDHPAGVDVRYETVFEDLQAEVDKLSLPSAASESIDWQKIENMAGSILANQSKDLLVAAYFCVARIHQAGCSGLAQGLRTYADLLENFWDTLFPPTRRMRGRVAAMEWWIEKSESALQLLVSPAFAEETAAEIREQTERINKLLLQYIPDTPISTHPLTAFLDNLPTESSSALQSEPEDTKPQKQPSEQKKEVVTPPPKSPPSQTEPQRQPAKPDEEGVLSMDSMLRALQRLAANVLDQDIKNPVSYRLLRFSLWSPVTEPPPLYDGKTLIPPPDPQTAMSLSNLFNQGDWHSLVTAAESYLHQYIFWLDLHRYSAISLDNLGNSYQDAAQCVAQETAFLLHRFPTIIDMKFADDTPFADETTRDWLQSIALGQASLSLDNAFAVDGEADALTDKLKDYVQQAQTLAKGKNILEATALLHDEIRRSTSAKVRMQWRLALCRLLVQNRSAGYALPHLHAVLEDIASYHIEEWEPVFALQTLNTVWECLRKISDKTAKDLAADVLDQIIRIDPVAGLRIGK